MLHHFQFEPRTILGVAPDASADQIRDAFHEKSKKHHPDLGGDEWAFRMVVRAYEVLKSTSNGLDVGGGVAPAPGASWGWPGPSPFVDPSARGASTSAPEPDEPTAEADAQTQTVPPGEFRAVDVELIWIRFEMPEKPGAEAPENSDRSTLSVCMVVSWPVKSLVARTAEFAGSGETLRQVIDGFERLDRGAALAVRTRIEDGQFVGWVSYPDVVAAQAAFLGFRDTLTNGGLSVRLQTRDEMIPQSWLV